MSRNAMPYFIPGVTYKLEQKPMINADGTHSPGGFNTFLAKYVSSDDSNYTFQLLEVIINNNIRIPYPDNTIVPMSKETLSKNFFVSENERVGGRKSRKVRKSRKMRKSRKI